MCRRFDSRWATFFAALIFSFLGMTIAAAGLYGLFGEGIKCYCTSIITLVLGIWVTAPKMKGAREVRTVGNPGTEALVGDPSDYPTSI